MTAGFPRQVGKYLDELITDVQRVLQPINGRIEFTVSDYRSIVSRCRHLASMLGEVSRWATELNEDCDNHHYTETYVVERLGGTLSGLRLTVNAGLMTSIADLARAETFGDLLDQADYLFGEGYALPAAVIGRAVLEEHLRKWCDRVSAVPTRSRPTIEDFRQALSAAKRLKTCLQLRKSIRIATTPLHGFSGQGRRSRNDE